MSAPRQQEVHDPYPTRLDHTITPIERREPSVWGSDHDGPLSEDVLDGFAAQGYLIRHGTVDDDSLPPLGRELERLAADLGDDPRIIREPGGTIRSIFEPHLLSELVAEVVHLDLSLIHI